MAEKLTPEEIIKALECCIKPTSDCENCPYYKKEECFDMAKRDALNLINRQQAKIEALVEDTLCLRDTLKENESLRTEIERLSNSAKQWEETAKDLLIGKEKQQAEIEQWKEEANRYQTLWCEDVQIARAEAIKEFARALRQQAFDRLYVSIDEIDNLVKEMTEPSLLDKKFGGEQG